jgi:hypothetical protein
VALAVLLDARNGDPPLQPAFLPFSASCCCTRRAAMPRHSGAPLPSWHCRTASDPVVRTPDGSLLRPQGDSCRAVPMADAGLYSAFAEA